MIEEVIDALTAKNRTVAGWEGKVSLCDLGYCTAGIDEGTVRARILGFSFVSFWLNSGLSTLGCVGCRELHCPVECDCQDGGGVVGKLFFPECYTFPFFPAKGRKKSRTKPTS